jgi:hypothetical protein
MERQERYGCWPGGILPPPLTHPAGVIFADAPAAETNRPKAMSRLISFLKVRSPLVTF